MTHTHTHTHTHSKSWGFTGFQLFNLLQLLKVIAMAVFFFVPPKLFSQTIIWNFNNHPTSYNYGGYFDFTDPIVVHQNYVIEVKMTNSSQFNSAHLSINNTVCPVNMNTTVELFGHSSRPINHDVYFNLNLPASTPQCDSFKIEFRILNTAGAQVWGWKGKTFIVNEYAHVNPQTVYTPDLMIRDHFRNASTAFGQTRTDFGEEPYQDWSWAWDYRNITKSPDLWNRHFNDNGTDFQNPMHSIQNPPNPNYVNVRIRNRGCAPTPPDQQLNLYWTIARLWEPWARDWKNFDNYDYVSADNKISTAVGEKPLGGAITLTDIYNYASDEFRINIGGFNGGEEKVIQAPWIVPNPAWYVGNTTLPIQFNRQNGLPVICLLARIDEGWRTDEGYYFNPSELAGTGIVEYVSPNNNVATHNTHIINSLNGYKWRDDNGNPRGIGGMVGVTGPNGGDAGVINIAFVRDTFEFSEEMSMPNFTLHGEVRLYLDLLLWERWLAGGAVAEGFTIDTAQVLIVNNPQRAVLYNISIEEGELAWLGTDALQVPGAEPSENYLCGYSIGAYDSAAQRTIGAPSHFEWHVLANPVVEGEEVNAITGMAMKSQVSQAVVQLYPNPAKDKLMVAWQQAAVHALHVYDINGRLVMSKQLEQTNQNLTVSIDVSALPQGVYYLELIGDAQMPKQKFVK